VPVFDFNANVCWNEHGIVVAAPIAFLHVADNLALHAQHGGGGVLLAPASAPSDKQTPPFTGCKVQGDTRSTVCGERLSCPKAEIEASKNRSTVQVARSIDEFYLREGYSFASCRNWAIVVNIRLAPVSDIEIFRQLTIVATAVLFA
jgi:hypothetical protein